MINLGSFNVRGSKPDIRLIFDLFNLDILCLTETWVTEFTPVPDSLQALHAAGYRSRNRHRLGGGVTILSRHNLHLVHTITSREVQAIVARTPCGTTLIGCYLSPQQPKDSIDGILDQLTKHVKGTCIIFGDFNARARQWDVAQNVHGTAIQRWIKRHHLQLSIPNHPTSMRNATVDLFLSKGLSPSTCETKSGSWDTDHRLIQCSFNQSTPWKPPRIPRKLFRNQEKMESAADYYESKLPQLTKRLSSCCTARDLDSLCHQFCKTMLQPFRGSYSPKPQRFRKGWDTHLDKLAARRKKLLRRQARAPDTALSEEIRHLDVQIKRQRRTNLRIASLREAAELENLDHTEAATRYSRNRALSGEKEPSTLPGELMTAHLESQQLHDAHIGPQTFTLGPSFAASVRSALLRSPKNRAPGPDGIVVELLLLRIEESTEIITEIWKSSGRIGHMPEFLRKGLIAPIFKKGDPTLASNYRPICLISHVRKIISSAINSMVQSSHDFHCQQFGFTPGLGTEDASLSAASIIRNGHKHVGILDLKGAYDRVRRDRLLQLLNDRLPATLAAMIQNLLVATTVSSSNQTTDTTAEITVGVPQGDPLSPTLYNIFMDTFLESYDGIDSSISATPAQCYADDVLLAAKSQAGLQHLLDLAASWAADTHMEWSIKKCFSISTSSSPFKLAGTPISNESSTAYLGTGIDLNGLTDEKCLERSKKALVRLQLWQKFENSTISLHRKTREILVKRFLLPSTDFGIHLSDISPQLYSAAYKFEARAVSWILQGRDGSNVARARSLTRLPTVTTRRHVQLLTRSIRAWNSAVLEYWTPSTRVKNRALENFKLVQAHPTFANVIKQLQLMDPTLAKPPTGCETMLKQLKDESLQSDWSIGNNGNRRKIPTETTEIPAYISGSWIHSTIADKWYLSRLPSLPQPMLSRLSILMKLNTWSKNQAAEYDTLAKTIIRDIL